MLANRHNHGSSERYVVPLIQFRNGSSSVVEEGKQNNGLYQRVHNESGLTHSTQTKEHDGIDLVKERKKERGE